VQILVSDLCAQALRLCGQSGRPGRGPGVEQLTEVTTYLNQMLDSWNAFRGSIFTVAINRYRLSPQQTTYFIGPTGDFVAERPIYIKSANLVLTGVFPEVFLPMRILNDDEWSDIRVREIPTTVPRLLYNDGASPDSQLYLWGYPTEVNDLELFTWQGLSTTLASTDTIIYPDGATRAIAFNLAVEIAPLYWKKTDRMLNLLISQAQKARAAYSNANQENPKIVSDAFLGMQREPDWDYYSYLTGGM
jgi:hypothetical protein